MFHDSRELTYQAMCMALDGGVVPPHWVAAIHEQVAEVETRKCRDSMDLAQRVSIELLKLEAAKRQRRGAAIALGRSKLQELWCEWLDRRHAGEIAG